MVIYANADPKKVDDIQVRESVGTPEANISIVQDMEAIALQYGIPIELINLYFCKLNGALYFKNPGLLFLAEIEESNKDMHDNCDNCFPMDD